ncbi:thiol-disulfide oxidoreductase DCC family protein [Virgibacillus sp. W0430]|uniref:thiol-disulfide oxidoreductase DCC family protein n=1 Tax=Virgibacillus sp. W0430 TaxID=3391580 RepID=UPI003F4902A5
MNAIVLFDGECSFCNRSVQFIIHRDREGFFKFASLESKIAQKYRHQLNIPNHLDSMILIYKGKWYAKSTAALRISKHLPGFWKLGVVLLAIPSYFRDVIYDTISKNRHHLFNKEKQCKIPNKDIQSRFL